MWSSVLERGTWLPQHGTPQYCLYTYRCRMASVAAPSGADGEVLVRNCTCEVRRGYRLERRCGTARASRAGTRPARPHCGQEGGHLRFPPSCQSSPFPSGRAARVEAGSRFAADAAHLLLQHGGASCHPAGARIARPSRPLCSDRREGCCHPGGARLLCRGPRTPLRRAPANPGSPLRGAGTAAGCD